MVETIYVHIGNNEAVFLADSFHYLHRAADNALCMQLISKRIAENNIGQILKRPHKRKTLKYRFTDLCAFQHICRAKYDLCAVF